MAWHDQSPWAAKHLDANEKADAKLAKVRRIVDDASAGRISPTKAVSAIEDAIADPIVRIGEGHKPEIQT